jgi:peptidoglycan/LPS O-acetylase OafA/YrhL
MSIHLIKYRKDIEGLRALAVLLVIGYHAFPKVFAGGFIGVDIFFVISGFLITKIILENLELNSFSFIEFYSRRIRRIFPALFLLLLACLVFGWFSLYATEYKRLTEHIAAGSVFLQNIVLLNEIGYFEKSIDTKPLVHLWSLSIEEQFYLLWPVILWVLYKKQFNISVFLIFLLFVSFITNIHLIDKNPITAFYSPLSRFWELIIGATWASFVFRNKAFKGFSFKTCNLLSFLGFGFFVIGVLIIDSSKKFPGYWALIPTFGALFLIAAGDGAIVNKEFLSNRLMTWLGKISYPLYLWHWTLLSFGQVITANKLSDLEKIILISASIGLSYLTNRYWENVLRFKGKKVTVFLLAGMVLIGSQGWNFYQRDGLDFRHKYVTDIYGGRPPQTDQQCLKRFLEFSPDFCRLSDNTKTLEVLIIGDSFAHNDYSGLASRYAGLGKSFAMVGWPGHQPLLKEPHEPNFELRSADRMNKLIVNLANDGNIKTVILTMRQPEIDSLIKTQLRRTVKYLENNSKKVIFIYPPPVLTFEPIECVGLPPFRPQWNTECIQHVKDIDPQYFIGRIELNDVIENLKIQSYDTYPEICTKDECEIRLENWLLYRQKGYFSVEGSKRVFQNFKE